MNLIRLAKHVSITSLLCVSFAQAALAYPCMPEFDNDYHYPATIEMCAGVTNFYIGGIQSPQGKLVTDRLIIRNAIPEGTSAFLSIEPHGIEVNGRTAPYIFPVSNGQCINLVSRVPDKGVFGYSLKLNRRFTSATKAEFDFQPNSSC